MRRQRQAVPRARTSHRLERLRRGLRRPWSAWLWRLCLLRHHLGRLGHLGLVLGPVRGLSSPRESCFPPSRPRTSGTRVTTTRVAAGVADALAPRAARRVLTVRDARSRIVLGSGNSATRHVKPQTCALFPLSETTARRAPLWSARSPRTIPFSASESSRCAPSRLSCTRLAAPRPPFRSTIVERANAEVAEAQRLGRFSLRDPLAPGDASRVRPCNFSSAKTVRLACLGHASWTLRSRIPEDRWDCQVPI